MKVIIKTTIGLLLILVFHQSSFGQDGTIVQRVITWHSDHNLELHSNTTFNVSCNITTRQNNTIDLEWGVVNTFTIVSIEGNWTDPAIDGSLTYHVSYFDKSGEITIQRIADQITILLDMTMDYADGAKEKFTISSYE